LKPAEREDRSGGLNLLLLDAWSREYPGIVVGVTLRPSDFGLSSSTSAWTVSERYESLGRNLGFDSIVVARQVHGTRVVVSSKEDQPGFRIAGEADGHVTARPGLLMTVTVADCVPVFLLDPDSGAAALLHAGWRGAAAGMLEQGIKALTGISGAAVNRLRVHLGPAICGDCYEVGPEVLSRFGLTGAGSGPLDLRDWLSAEARRHGVRPEAISRSARCTACDPVSMHSHRGSGGTAGRMAAFLGWRARPV
jgi:YfiH family protein